MNKTVTINISGIIFHIEEDAYDSLSKYLSTIKGYFSKTDGGNEIMGDIEARIAELLQAKINTSKQVILMSDVEHVMNVMGKPEDFRGEDAGPENDSNEDQAQYATEKVKRRLFRDPDEKAIGGVCSGLAAYFGIEIVWVRLAMFLLVFFGGVSIWVYIILWIVIPEAKTTADRLAMRGESANINTIYRSFKDEAEDVKNRFNKYGREFKSEAEQMHSRMKGQGREFRNQGRAYSESVRANIGAVLNTIFNIAGRLLGLFLILIGGILLFGYLASLFGISVLSSSNQIIHWRRVIFDSPSDYVLGVIAFIIVVGIPVMMLIYGGVKLLFRIRYSNRWLNMGLGVVWIIGIVLGFYVTVDTVKQFSESARSKETYTLRNIGDTLIVKMNPGVKNLKTLNFDNTDDIEAYLAGNSGGYFFGESNKNLSVIGFAELNVTESNTDSVELIITRSARDNAKRGANENANAIGYTYQQDKNTLLFDQIFTVTEGSKFRAQELDIKIKLPKGKVIYFDKSTKYLLNDIDNTSNTWAGKMISRRWKMTEKGLECIDCEGLDAEEDTDDFPDRKSRKTKLSEVVIDGDGIEVNGRETEIKINEDGILIKTPEENIELSNDKKEKKNKN